MLWMQAMLWGLLAGAFVPVAGSMSEDEERLRREVLACEALPLAEVFQCQAERLAGVRAGQRVLD